jgi:hypothetical protein
MTPGFTYRGAGGAAGAPDDGGVRLERREPRAEDAGPDPGPVGVLADKRRLAAGRPLDHESVDGANGCGCGRDAVD